MLRRRKHRVRATGRHPSRRRSRPRFLSSLLRRVFPGNDRIGSGCRRTNGAARNDGDVFFRLFRNEEIVLVRTRHRRRRRSTPTPPDGGFRPRFRSILFLLVVPHRAISRVNLLRSSFRSVCAEREKSVTISSARRDISSLSQHPINATKKNI